MANLCEHLSMRKVFTNYSQNKMWKKEKKISIANTKWQKNIINTKMP